QATTHWALDDTFGNGGQVTTSFGEGHNSANALAVYPAGSPDAGKILAVGEAAGAEGHDIGVVRYKPNGALDKTYHGSGKFQFGIFANGVATTANPRAAAIYPPGSANAGKIVVAGYYADP